MNNHIAQFLDNARDAVRAQMNTIARWIESSSKGRVQPDTITYVGLLMHVPIALLIATQSYYWAAGLLIVFGLFDALDGALARVKKQDSPAGMLLDASTDRIKEVFLYIGAAYALVATGNESAAIWAVAACGASICVSYVKAKGETAVKDTKLSTSEVNKLFADGFMRFEIRMTFLILGLITGYLEVALIIITLLSTYTTFDRLTRIRKRLLQS